MPKISAKPETCYFGYISLNDMYRNSLDKKHFFFLSNGDAVLLNSTAQYKLHSCVYEIVAK